MPEYKQIGKITYEINEKNPKELFYQGLIYETKRTQDGNDVLLLKGYQSDFDKSTDIIILPPECYRILQWALKGLDIKYIAGSGVSQIDADGLSLLENLIGVGFPNLKYIGADAFCNDKSLKCVVFPKLIIANGCGFQQCSSLESAIFGKDTQSLGEWLFKDCENLKAFTIPAAIRHLRDNVFVNCKSLSRLVVNHNIKDIDGNPIPDSPHCVIKTKTKEMYEAFNKLSTNVSYKPIDISR